MRTKNGKLDCQGGLLAKYATEGATLHPMLKPLAVYGLIPALLLTIGARRLLVEMIGRQ